MAVLGVQTGEIRFFGKSLAQLVNQSPNPKLSGPYGQVATIHGVTLPPLTEIAPGEPLQAFVYNNKWIVACPTCGSHEFAFETEQLMMCSCCFNGASGGKWRRIVFPENRADIEAALVLRPDPHTRLWSPGETVEQLLAENAAHGIAEAA